MNAAEFPEDLDPLFPVAQARQSDAACIIHTAAGALVRVVPEVRKAALPKIGDLVEVCAFLTD